MIAEIRYKTSALKTVKAVIDILFWGTFFLSMYIRVVQRLWPRLYIGMLCLFAEYNSYTRPLKKKSSRTKKKGNYIRPACGIHRDSMGVARQLADKRTRKHCKYM